LSPRATPLSLWIYADDTDALTTDLSEDLGIDQITVIESVEEQMFVRVNWNPDHESVLTAIVNTDVTLLSEIGNNEQWTFEVRASKQQAVADFQTYCQEQNIPIRLTQLHALSALRSDREYDLTSGQREALILAYSRGYVDSPREATQADLATRDYSASSLFTATARQSTIDSEFAHHSYRIRQTR